MHLEHSKTGVIHAEFRGSCGHYSGGMTYGSEAAARWDRRSMEARPCCACRIGWAPRTKPHLNGQPISR